MRKIAVHGTPITGRSQLLNMSGKSFCVSFAEPRDLATCETLQDPTGILLLDNGAFSAWRRGYALDVDGFYAWASAAMDRSPAARAICPDVIGGTSTDNGALIEACPLDWSRTYVVWHLDESLDLLASYADRFPLIALGSCAEYDVQRNPAGYARRTSAATEIIRAGSAGSEIHGLRALGVLARFDLDSADSTNVAVNHKPWAARRGLPTDDRRARRMADWVEERIAA